MRIIMHNNIIDREVEVGRSFSQYANIFSNKRRALTRYVN